MMKKIFEDTARFYDPGISDGIKNVEPLSTRSDEPETAEDCKVLRDICFSCADNINQFLHRERSFF